MTSPSHVTDLALNPNSGLMYFSTGGNIMQANMDGSGIEEFISNDIIRPVSILLDLTKEGEDRLYWADAEKRTISFIKLDGSKQVVNIKWEKPSAFYPFLNFLEDQLIYVDNNYNFKSINKQNGSDVWKRRILERIQGDFQHFTICDGRNQPKRRDNPCEGIKCDCLCVLAAGTEDGFKCLCPTGKVLDLDGLTCIESKLAIAEGNTIKLIGVDVIGTGEFETITIKEIKAIKTFCNNPRNHSLILYDSVLKKIVEYDLIKRETRVLVDGQVENVVDIGIDAIAQNIYWINPQRQTLEVMSLESSARKILRFDLEKNANKLFVPSALNIDIFTSGTGWIREYSNRDGISSLLFSDAGRKPIGLSYDLVSNKLLWIEGTRGTVFSSTTRFNHVTIQKSILLGSVRDGVIHQGSVYWIPENVEELRFTRIGSNNISKVIISGYINGKVAILDGDMDHLSLSLREHECSWGNLKRKNCSHICIQSGQMYTNDVLKGECICPDGFELGEDGLTCERQNCNEMPTQFECNDGTCISSMFVCDEAKDCGENEDEMENICLKWKPGYKHSNSADEESN